MVIEFEELLTIAESFVLDNIEGLGIECYKKILMVSKIELLVETGKIGLPNRFLIDLIVDFQIGSTVGCLLFELVKLLIVHFVVF